jgi:hypothetical protein
MTHRSHITEVQASEGSHFAVQVLDKESMRMGSYFLHHSSHSRMRMRQRGLSNLTISLALEYGDCLLKQGLEFYVLGNKDLPPGLPAREAERVRNTVVVINPTGEILTCYRRRGGLKYLRKKPKHNCRAFSDNRFSSDFFMAAA